MTNGFFKPSEFACKDGSKSPHGEWNVVPDLVALCNRLRRKVGFPLYVASGYRSPSHNAAVGGVPNSLHVQGKACDLHPYGKLSGDEKKKRIEELWDAAEEINIDGGVGLYDWGVHIDCRGTKARWDYRS